MFHPLIHETDWDDDECPRKFVLRHRPNHLYRLPEPHIIAEKSTRVLPGPLSGNHPFDTPCLVLHVCLYPVHTLSNDRSRHIFYPKKMSRGLIRYLFIVYGIMR